MAHHLSDNIEGTIGGTIGTLIGSLLGFITISNVLETAALAVIGGVIGFYTNKFLKWIHKK